MRRITKTLVMVIMLGVLGGCTIHFKAKEIELETDGQKVERNHTYELEKVEFFRG